MLVRGRSHVALQRAQRATRASDLSDALWRVHMPHSDLEVTGELFPRGTLRRRSNRQRLAFLADFAGRFFTRKICLKAIKKLVHEHDLRPLRQPSESMAQWCQRQAVKLQRVAKRAKAMHRAADARTRAVAAIAHARAKAQAMATSPDNYDTLPFDSCLKTAPKENQSSLRCQDVALGEVGPDAGTEACCHVKTR